MRYVMLLILISIVLFTTPLYASTVTDYDGGVITCTGAGTKTTAAPILWDNFEDGTDGAYLPTSDNWTAYVSDGGFYDDQQAYSGSLSAYNYVNSEGGGYNGFNTSYTQFTATDEVYITYKFRYEATGSKYGQGKMCRINSSSSAGGGGVYHDAGSTGYSNVNLYYSTSGYTFYYREDDIETSLGYHSCAEDQWVTQQLYKKVSTAGIGDGVVWCNNVGISSVLSESAVTRASGETFQQDTVLLGLMWANIGTQFGDASVKIFIDDIYIDNTLSRVMIGDTGDIDTCTVLEPQIPSAWSDTEITITENLGSFDSGDTVYLFVFDSDGNASDGYEITIGSSSSVLPGINGTVNITGSVTITP